MVVVGSGAGRVVAVVGLLEAVAGDDPVPEAVLGEREADRDNGVHLTAPEGAIFLTTGAWMPLPV